MKPVHFIGRCRSDLRRFPEDARREVGFALFLAQTGDKATNAVPLVGFGSSKVLEVLIDCDRCAYRAVYTVKLADAVYVLHAFQKKSRKGIETPRPDIRLIRERLRIAEAHYLKHYAGEKGRHDERGARRKRDR